MSNTSAVHRLDIFIASSTLAAHASFIEEGFRLRDLRFFCELFLNWAEDLDVSASSLQNTQLARFLADLVKQGFAKRSQRKQVQLFKLTRLGLLELLTRMNSSRHASHPSTVLFRLCFIKSYRHRLEALVEREGAHFPHSLKLEVAALLDLDAIIDQEIAKVERALQRKEQRVEDALKISALAKNLNAAKVPFAQIVDDVESRYPYELNTMKPLHELIASIAPDQRRWELEEGTLIRAHTLWGPQRELLRIFLERLKLLRG